MSEQTIYKQVCSDTMATIYDSDDEERARQTSDPEFAQVGPEILKSLHLEDADEWLTSYTTEYEWNYHPKYPKKYLIWATFKSGAYRFYELKVLDTRSEELIYTIGLSQISKSRFDREYGTIDSDKFNLFKQVNQLEETPFFREGMEQLLSINQ